MASQAMTPDPRLTPTERFIVSLLETGGPATLRQLQKRTGANNATVRNAIRCLLMVELVQWADPDDSIPAADRTYSITTLKGLIS